MEFGTWESPANATRDFMWRMLMDHGQKANVPALREAVYALIKATTQMSAGQKEQFRARGDVDWRELDMELWTIVIEATALVLSGRLDGMGGRR